MARPDPRKRPRQSMTQPRRAVGPSVGEAKEMKMTNKKFTTDDLDDLAMQCEDGPEVTVGAPVLLSLIAAARELAERRWIPVSERLPEDEAEVLASTAFGERVMRGASNFRHLGVTHWMPLPKGPTNGR